MKKGQISLDLIMTLIIALIIIGASFTIINNIKETNEIVFLQNQLKKEANKYSNFINSTSILDDTNFRTEIKIDKIIFENTKIMPEFNIDEDNKKISVSVSEIIVDENVYLENKIITQENGFLVIENE
jgi:beta-galactosidase/beta-glucuronidase